MYVNASANPGKDQTAATWVATNLLVTCRLQLCTREIGTRRDGHSGVTPTALHFHNEANPCDVPRIRGGRRHLCDGSACCILPYFHRQARNAFESVFRSLCRFRPAPRSFCMAMTNGGDQTAQLTVLAPVAFRSPKAARAASLWKSSPTASRIVRMSSAWRFPNIRPCAP